MFMPRDDFKNYVRHFYSYKIIDQLLPSTSSYLDDIFSNTDSLYKELKKYSKIIK